MRGDRTVRCGAAGGVALAALIACWSSATAFGTTEWRPSPMHATHSSLSEVLAFNAKAAGSAEAGFTRRREHWTYAHASRRLDVHVAIRDEDYRATIALGTSVYEAGRSKGAGWRTDANGAMHLTFSEDQGDALDRIPRALFPLDASALSVAGETDGASPAWVIADRPARDKPRWLFVDRASGLIVREIVREGGRTIVTTFDRFERAGGSVRARRWRVRDGTNANDVDAQVESVAPGAIGADDVAIPRHQRFFAPFERPMQSVTKLPAVFNNDRILLDVDLNGHQTQMALDTGTASITLDSATARRYGWEPVLEHATVPRITTGGFSLTQASVLAIPLSSSMGAGSGILGLDFFAGHVVHIDYQHERVEILSPETGEAVFNDPNVTVLAADVSEGLPLVHAGFGRASGDRFAVDTGSSSLYVLDPFVQRWPAEVARWSPTTFDGRTSVRTEGYLEGSIRVAARRVSGFEFGPLRFTQETVGVEEPNVNANAITIPLDGIIGTNHLRLFDLWFDYDQERMALRRNARR